MLIIHIAFIACISAVDIDPEAVRSAAHSLLKLGRMSGNQQLSSNLANSKNPTYKSFKEVWSSNSIPNLVVSHKIMPFLTFREAINAKVMDEQEIIKYFASKDYNDPKVRDQTYQDIINYITRDLGKNEISDLHRIFNLELFLDNAKDAGKLKVGYNNIKRIFEYGNLDLLKYLVKKENFHQFSDLKFLPFALAARNGHTEMVKWILKRSSMQFYYTYFILESLGQDEKKTLGIILEIAATETPKIRMDVFNEALAYSFLHSRGDFVNLVLKKALEGFKDHDLSRWSENFLKMYSKKKWNPKVKNLDYFFSQQVWKPRTVRSFLTAMLTASDNVIERIGMELLNPRLKFRDTKGSDPLEKAIEMASSKNQAKYGRVLHVLQDIQRKRSTDLRDQETVHGAHVFGKPFFTLF